MRLKGGVAVFGFLKKRRQRQAAYAAGQRAGQALRSAVDAYLDARIPEVSGKLLDALRQRLTTIHDEPGVDAKTVARIEFGIFLDYAKTYRERLRADLKTYLSLTNRLEVIEETGTSSLINQHADRRIAAGAEALLVDALSVLAEVVGELPAEVKS